MEKETKDMLENGAIEKVSQRQDQPISWDFKLLVLSDTVKNELRVASWEVEA